VSNIDSKTDSDTHDRFKRRRVEFRFLLSLTQIPFFQQPASLGSSDAHRAAPIGHHLCNPREYTYKWYWLRASIAS
jgi:hypothetical protein